VDSYEPRSGRFSRLNYDLMPSIDPLIALDHCK